MPLERFHAIAEVAERGEALPPHRAISITGADDCGCGGSSPASTESTTDFAVHVERLRPFIERIGATGVVYEHSANGSPATVILAELHPGKVISFSPHHANSAFETFREHGRERVTLISSEKKPPIYEADLIVLTGFGNRQELQSHLIVAGEKSRRLIAIEDTNRSGIAEEPDLMAALRIFLNDHQQWSVISHSQNGDDLTILSRDAWDKPQLPSKITMAANFAQAVAKHVADGANKVDQVTLEWRLEICTFCEHRRDDRCSVCGCFLAEKASWRSSKCPLGKMDRVKLHCSLVFQSTLGLFNRNRTVDQEIITRKRRPHDFLLPSLWATP